MPKDKKVANIPVLSAVVNIIQYLRQNASASPEELLAKAGAKSRTFYRALNALQEAGVVVKRDDGRQYWYEYVEAWVFKNKFEAELVLNHSKNVAKGLRFLIGEEKQYFEEENINLNKEYLDYAIMHLNTGYPEIFQNYSKAEKARKEMNEEELKAKERIHEKILTSYKVLYPEHISYIILEDIKEVLIGRAPQFLQGLKIEGGEIKSMGYTLAKKEAYKELKKFIMKEEVNEENRNSCGNILNLGTRYYNLEKDLQIEIDTLIMMVENGTPLRGRCKLCPKLKIEKES
jgi:DNA-binding transcriptional ArsR family regulator